MPKPKQNLYATFFDRAERAHAAGRHLEGSWYAYAVLEDRMRSLLRSSGGESKLARGKPELIRMMGPKLALLKKRAGTNPRLSAILAARNGGVREVHPALIEQLEKWTLARNDLMHAMAEGTARIDEIDAQAARVSAQGVALMRECSTGARRLKRHAVDAPL